MYLANVYDKFPANSPNGTYTFTYGALNNTREDLVRIDANLTNKLHFFARAMRDETPENFPQGLFAGLQLPEHRRLRCQRSRAERRGQPYLDHFA